MNDVTTSQPRSATTTRIGYLQHWIQGLGIASSKVRLEETGAALAARITFGSDHTFQIPDNCEL